MKDKIEYLLVPCAGNPSFSDSEVKFSDLEDDKSEPDFKLYLGAKDRMKAAVAFAKNCNKVVLIGGSQSKVLSMYIYFDKEIRRLNYKFYPEIICLVSKPDSTGNLSAFRKYIERQKMPSQVAIISNKYHLERLKLIWGSIFSKKQLNLRLISAEKVLGEATSEALYEVELKRREIKEKAGCREWKNKSYNHQDKIENWDEAYWSCQKLELSFKLPL